MKIEECSSLVAGDRASADRLVALCQKADRFPQKLEDDSALNFDKSLPAWILAREREGLAGIASLFAPSQREIEISAWTAPERRRQGVFSAIVEDVRTLAKERKIPSILLCVDGRSESGALAAGSLGAMKDFSEYRMEHDVAEGEGKRGETAGRERITILPAGFEVRETAAEDVDRLARASVDIFGESEESARNFIMVSMKAPSRTQYSAWLDGRIVGMCATTFLEEEPRSESGSVMINGLGILASMRGKGLGKALLYRVMELAAEKGARRIELEVDTVNEAAYPLYLSAGFVETSRTDYYRIMV